MLDYLKTVIKMILINKIVSKAIDIVLILVVNLLNKNKAKTNKNPMPKAPRL
jgi:hypothetical protein